MNRARRIVSFDSSLIVALAAVPVLSAATSCSKVSEIVLVVDTDMLVPSEIDLVDISVTGPSGPTSPIPSIDLNQTGAPPFPLTLGLVDKGTSSKVTVTVTGRHHDASQAVTDVASVEVSTRFVDGQKLMLPVLLSASCLGISCTDPKNPICNAGICSPLVLPPWTGPPPAKEDVRPIPVDSRALWSTGWRSCATRGQGLYCWGENDNGQTGNGVAGGPERTRVLVKSLPPGPLKSIGLGYKHSCVCDSTGQAWCWGQNDNGQVLPGGASPILAPVKVPGVTDCAQIVAGGIHTCAIVMGTRVSCWGGNDAGQVGQPLTMAMTMPQVVAGVAAVFQVQAGDKFTCTISTTNAVNCWGDNGRGQLGDGTTTRSPTPKRIAGLSDRPSNLALGRNFACLLFTTGQVACWGENSDTMIGTGATVITMPTLISGITDAARIAAGHQHACVLRSSGSVSCWGSNQFGQLGVLNVTSSAVPVDVVGLAGAMSWLAVGDQHSCARDAKGTVYCWGQDVNGQLGDGGANPIMPMPVAAIGF